MGIADYNCRQTNAPVDTYLPGKGEVLLPSWAKVGIQVDFGA